MFIGTKAVAPDIRNPECKQTAANIMIEQKIAQKIAQIIALMIIQIKTNIQVSTQEEIKI